MNARDHTLLRLVCSHTKHSQAFPILSGSYAELLSAYTDLLGAVKDHQLNGTKITPDQVKAVHEKAMASIKSFRKAIAPLTETDDNSNEEN